MDGAAKPLSRTTKEPPLLELRDQGELHEWLLRNHAASGGVRLAIGKRGNTVTSLTYDQAVDEGIAFGWIDSTTRRLDEDRFAILFTPRRAGSTWARSNKERFARLSREGRMMPAGVDAVERAQADGSWTLLDHVEDMVVSQDLAAALAAAPDGRGRFEALSDSARKQILYWIESAKRPATRAARISETVRALAAGELPGPLKS